MSTRTGRFRRADRLLDSRDFRRIGRIGKRLASRYFVVLWVASEVSIREAGQRLGVTVSRRVGNAVVRNRVKRGVREWFRQQRSELEDPLELVVIARHAAAELSAMEISNELNGLLKVGCSR